MNPKELKELKNDIRYYLNVYQKDVFGRKYTAGYIDALRKYKVLDMKQGFEIEEFAEENWS